MYLRQVICKCTGKMCAMQVPHDVDDVGTVTGRSLLPSMMRDVQAFNQYFAMNVSEVIVPGIVPTDINQVGSAVDGPETGMIAGIVIAVVTFVLILAALIALLVYRHYLHRNVTSMNFDNPVYRKTTEDQFSLEKNQYQPPRIYPATVGEEAQEPLTSPGTNDYV